jgi:hypothetical protein
MAALLPSNTETLHSGNVPPATNSVGILHNTVIMM